MDHGSLACYQDAGFFVLRTPLLPYQCFFALSDGVGAGGRDLGSGLADRLADERACVTSNVRRALEPAAVREALWVASPSLHEALEQWERGALAPDAARKVVHSLHRYLGRMCTRSTPFGLFAGSSIGRLDARTELVLSARAANRRYTTLDNSYLFLLLRELDADPRYRAVATYHPNSGIYRVAGKLRYAETAVDPSETSMSYQLASLERDEALELALERARGGATAAALAEALVAGLGVDREQAAAFVDLLVDNQVLVSDLHVAVTGHEPLVDAHAQLRAHPEPGIAAALDATAARLRALDQGGFAPPQAYHDVIAELRRLPVEDLEPSRLFHVDLWKPLVDARLGAQVVAELRAAVEGLHRVAAVPSRTELDDLVDAFRARHGEGPVPLGVALDPELGIAAGSASIASESTAILAELEFRERDPDDHPEPSSLAPRERHLLETLHSLWSRGEREWVLDERDARALEVADKPSLPSSFAAWFQLARRPGAPGEGHEIYLASVVGPPAGRLLGRFAHGSPELTARVRELAQQEASLEPEAILAEIVHLPEGRTGNVVCRPILRDYEIPYLGRSGVARDHQIPIDDLWLGLEDGRFVLRSQTLGRRVIPRLSCAHNVTHNTVPLYRFLARLQAQGCCSWLSWSWGRFQHAPHLPRVRLGPVIVSRETWTLDARDLETLRPSSATARHAAIVTLRQRHRLPRFVALADGDNELAVDLENVVGVDSFAELVKARPRARLHELWPGPDAAGVAGEDGWYANEIVVPFVRRAEPRTVTVERGAVDVAARAPACPRSLPPDGSWLELRLVTSKSSADELLVHGLAETIDGLLRDGACDRWCFTPEPREDWALRLRFHGEPAQLEATALPRLGAVLRAAMVDGPLRSWSVEPSVESVERHGGVLALDHVQRLAFHDSQAALALLAVLLAAGDEGKRWQLVTMSIDRLLGDLGLRLGPRGELAQRLRAECLRSLPVGDAIEGQLSRTFRAHRALVESLLEPGLDEGLPREVEPILARRSRQLEPIVAGLHALRDGDRLTCPWPHVVARIVRATAHRLLRGAALAHELVIHDVLHRAYRSRLGRARQHASRPQPQEELAR